MEVKKLNKYPWWLSIIVLIAFLFVPTLARGETIPVDPDQAYKDYSNELYLTTTPVQSGVSYTSNIPASRLNVYKKSKNVPKSEYGSIWYFGTKGVFDGVDFTKDNYQISEFEEYISGWDSIGFDIDNITKTDYIETTHKKIGKYQGKWIDAKIKYTNFQHIPNVNQPTYGIIGSKSYLDISENLTNGYMYGNISYMDIEATFTDSTTGVVVDFISSDNNHSFLTFSSLNARYLRPSGGIGYHIDPDDEYPVLGSEFAKYLNEDTITGSGKAYVTKDSNIQVTEIPFTKYPGKVYNGRTDQGFDDHLGSLTFKKNSVSFEIKGKVQKFAVGSGRGYAWNTYSGATLFMSTMVNEKPIKSVKNTAGVDINGKEVNLGDIVNWEIKVPIGEMGVTLLEKYSNLVVKDPLPAQVTYKNYKVFDETNKDITNQTTVVKDGNTVKVTFKPDYLLNVMKYEGEVYRVVFETTVNSNLTGYHQIKNYATVTYNQMELKTNEVSVFVNKPVIPDPAKTVFLGTTEYNGKTVMPGQELVYEVSQKVNKQGTDINSKYTKFNLIDTLDSKVTYKSAELLKNGTVVAGAKTLSYDAGTRTVSFIGDSTFLSGMEMNNETYTLRIKVTVNGNVENGSAVTNKAQSIVNSTSKDTNEVKNPVVVPVIPTPEKKVFSGTVEYNGKTVRPGQELTYEVSQKVNKQGTDILSKYTKFNLIDKLDEKVTYKSAEFLKNGTVVAGAKTLSYDAGTRTVSFIGDSTFLSGMEMNNETYTLRVKVTVNSNVENGSVVTNKAQSIVNSTSKDTNEVKNPIFVPKESKVTKYILNGDKQETDSKVEIGKNFNYVVEFFVGDGEEITSLRLYDALESVHTLVGATVLDQDGKDITSQGTLATANATFDWKATKPNDFKGKTLKVVITAKLNNVPELSKYLNNGVIQVPNTAKLILNTKETTSNKVTVTPPTVTTKALKFIVKE